MERLIKTEDVADMLSLSIESEENSGRSHLCGPWCNQ